MPDNANYEIQSWIAQSNQFFISQILIFNRNSSVSFIYFCKDDSASP